MRAVAPARAGLTSSDSRGSVQRSTMWTPRIWNWIVQKGARGFLGIHWSRLVNNPNGKGTEEALPRVRVLGGRLTSGPCCIRPVPCWPWVRPPACQPWGFPPPRWSHPPRERTSSPPVLARRELGPSGAPRGCARWPPGGHRGCGPAASPGSPSGARGAGRPRHRSSPPPGGTTGQ